MGDIQKEDERTESECTDIAALIKDAREAANLLAASSSEARNSALAAVKEALERRSESIFASNAKDTARLANSSELHHRLLLTPQKLQDCIRGLQVLIEAPDPLNTCTLATELADQLELYRITCPLGLIAVVFEARPEAAIQIACLGIKSGNAVILKGGKEAVDSNREICAAIKDGLRRLPSSSGIGPNCLQLVETRVEVMALLERNDLIDLVIPRGSKELVNFVKGNTRIPVLGHAEGVCAVYVDAQYDSTIAIPVVKDSKIGYPAACNACETLLVHREAVASFLPNLVEALKDYQMTYFADCWCSAFLPPTNVKPVMEEHYSEEFLGAALVVIAVDSVAAAAAHINRFGSHHTDVIVSSDPQSVDFFMRNVHSAGVFHNASSRFADGFRYGFGAEVGISTGRIHCRGPVGLEGLLTYKYRLFGSGHVVGPPLTKPFNHRRLPLDGPLTPLVTAALHSGGSPTAQMRRTFGER